MVKISVLLVISLILAHLSEQRTREAQATGRYYSVWTDPDFLLLAGILVLFAGLRVNYNDTMNYIRGYNSAPALAEFLSEPENWNPMKNPLFYSYQALLKTLGCDAQMLVFTTSLLAQPVFLRFLKRYSRNFTFSVFLYFTLGTFCLTLAAMKQVTAMAILLLAFSQMQEKHYVRYYLLVFVAMLVHTYAIAFVILPLFNQRPWKLFTYLFAVVLIMVMVNFETAITNFLEQAEEMGKSIAEYEVFDNHSINIFRLGVYAVAPLLSFVFQRWIFYDSSDSDHTLVHMGIISFAFMIMGTQSGANMFGRMANYFEIGTVCCLPWMLDQTFEKRSYRLIFAIAIICFLGFFVYANGINTKFDEVYSATSLLNLILS